MLSKKLFLEITKPFFDAGLVKEIYSTDKFMIMNMANKAYYITDYFISSDNNASAVTISVEVAKLIINDENSDLCYHYMVGLGRKGLRESTMMFTQRTFGVLKEIKARTDIEGPSKFIDLEFEEKLLKQQK